MLIVEPRTSGPLVATLIASDAIEHKRFVSKNVCHGVVYDRELHEHVGAFKDRSLSLELIWRGMDRYLGKSDGKKLHDPLAACCADPSSGEWAEVELYRERGQWGSRLAPGSGVHIIVGYDRAKFIETFTATA